jgi:excisionase family DNA binding protein
MKIPINDISAPTPDDFLDKSGVASLLHVSRRTVDNLTARGELPVCRLSKRLLRYPRAAVVAAMNARAVGRRN